MSGVKWIMAIKDGNLTEIKACIAKYGNEVLKLRDSNKKTALHISAYYGSLEGTKFFIPEETSSD